MVITTNKILTAEYMKCRKELLCITVILGKFIVLYKKSYYALHFLLIPCLVY